MVNNKHFITISKTYYGSWEALLELVNQKLDFYIHILPIFTLLKSCGLRPGYMLDHNHPAYFSDEIAQSCLATYDPLEPMDAALERCITDQLHRRITHMENADLSKVRMDERIWEMFLLDDLLRWVWRCRKEALLIPFYLCKRSQTELSIPFLLEAVNGCIRLTQCTCRRQYEANAQLDYETFCQQMYHMISLATEDIGHLVPYFVWLSPNFNKGETK
jgi:hypothetical protein